MFFYLSKILWFLVNPANLLLIALVIGFVLLLTRRTRTGRLILGLCVGTALFMATVPVGKSMMMTLENRFPINRQLPEKVDGIIVLGGVVNEIVTQSRGQLTVGGGISRLIEFSALSKKFPQAKLVFTGGSGKLLSQNIKEADVLEPLLLILGIDVSRVIYENKSRNTYENATLTRSLVDPGPGETWILITSAFHMPRSMGVFRQAGWNIIAYPVDYNFATDETLSPAFDLLGGLNSLSAGLHEWLGLAFYRLTGKTDSFFPAP